MAARKSKTFDLQVDAFVMAMAIFILAGVFSAVF